MAQIPLNIASLIYNDDGAKPVLVMELIERPPFDAPVEWQPTFTLTVQVPLPSAATKKDL